MMVLQSQITVLFQSSLIGLNHQGIFLGIKLSGLDLEKIAFQNIFCSEIHRAGRIEIAHIG